MRYEIIVLDDSSRLSEESLDFVRKLQQFIELNYSGAEIVKLQLGEELTPLMSTSLKFKEIN